MLGGQVAVEAGMLIGWICRPADVLVCPRAFDDKFKLVFGFFYQRSEKEFTSLVLNTFFVRNAQSVSGVYLGGIKK